MLSGALRIFLLERGASGPHSSGAKGSRGGLRRIPGICSGAAGLSRPRQEPFAPLASSSLTGCRRKTTHARSHRDAYEFVAQRSCLRARRGPRHRRAREENDRQMVSQGLEAEIVARCRRHMGAFPRFRRHARRHRRAARATWWSMPALPDVLARLQERLGGALAIISGRPDRLSGRAARILALRQRGAARFGTPDRRRSLSLPGRGSPGLAPRRRTAA